MRYNCFKKKKIQNSLLNICHRKAEVSHHLLFYFLLNSPPGYSKLFCKEKVLAKSILVLIVALFTFLP